MAHLVARDFFFARLGASTYFWFSCPVGYNAMEQVWSVLQDPVGFHYVPGKTPLSLWWQPVAVSVGYLVLIFTLRAIMKNFNALSLKWVSAAHNLNLFIISVVCFVGMVHGLYEKLTVRFRQFSRFFRLIYRIHQKLLHQSFKNRSIFHINPLPVHVDFSLNFSFFLLLRTAQLVVLGDSFL